MRELWTMKCRLLALSLLIACGDDDLVFDLDAGPDAAEEDSGLADTAPGDDDAGTDASSDSGVDAGPPPTDSHLDPLRSRAQAMVAAPTSTLRPSTNATASL